MPARFDVERFVVGSCLILLGTLWTLSLLGTIEMLPVLRRWWPLALVVWGAAELFNTLVVARTRR